MRENCTYGSMRDILRAAGESRSDALAEVRAHPTGASRSTLHPAEKYSPHRPGRRGDILQYVAL